MIRDLNKRKELAQMVYNRYGDQFGVLTKEDKKDLEKAVDENWNIHIFDRKMNN